MAVDEVEDVRKSDAVRRAGSPPSSALVTMAPEKTAAAAAVLVNISELDLTGNELDRGSGGLEMDGVMARDIESERPLLLPKILCKLAVRLSLDSFEGEELALPI